MSTAPPPSGAPVVQDAAPAADPARTVPAPARKGPSVGTWRPWAVLPWALAFLALPLIALVLRFNFGTGGWLTVFYLVYGIALHEFLIILMLVGLLLLPRVNPRDERRGGIRLGRLLHTLLGVSWGSFALAAILFPDFGDAPDSSGTAPVLMDLLGTSTAMQVGSVGGLALMAVSAAAGVAVIVVCAVRRIRAAR